MSEFEEPPGLDAVMAKLKALEDENLVLHEDFPTLQEFHERSGASLEGDNQGGREIGYTMLNCQQVPKGIPNFECYRVIADYLIHAPILAVNFGAKSATYGRVMGYCGPGRWFCADSLEEFLHSLDKTDEGAFFGRSGDCSEAPVHVDQGPRYFRAVLIGVGIFFGGLCVLALGAWLFVYLFGSFN